MNAEASNTTQMRFSNDLLPSLGDLLPGMKNRLSPFNLQFEKQAAPGEIEATGLLGPDGKIKASYLSILQLLANPESLVDLRFVTGGNLQQFSLYYAQPDAPAVMLMNTSEGLLLEYPADIKAIVDVLLQFSSDSMLVSFDLDITLTYSAALALAALIDLHRRQVARSFADLVPVETITFSSAEIEDWITRCPEDPQWFTDLIPQQEPGSSTPVHLLNGLTQLIGLEICQAVGDGYALAGPALSFGNRMILIENIYALDIIRTDSTGQMAFASIAALQAGINDLVQIEFLEEGVAFKSLAPIHFILEIEHFLEKGGQVLPDPPVPPSAVPAGEAPTLVPNTCQQCGQPLSPTAKFCARCGAQVAQPVASQKLTCPYCQQALNPQAKFCRHCGKQVRSYSEN